MPAELKVHYNTPADDGKTRCGLRLFRVKWAVDTKDVTCNRCNRLVRNQK